MSMTNMSWNDIKKGTTGKGSYVPDPTLSFEKPKFKKEGRT